MVTLYCEPHHRTLCKEIEDVIAVPRNLPPAYFKWALYPDRMAALNLPSLEHKRKRGDMIDLYKYLHTKSAKPPFELDEGKD